MRHRLEWDGKTSREFDMRCYRVMTSAFWEKKESFDVSLAGLADLFDVEEELFFNIPANVLLPFMDKIMEWHRTAANCIKKDANSQNTRMIEGNPIVALYSQLFKAHGTLPSEIDRQNPELFFAVLTERHISERDIPKGMGVFYGL